MESFKLSLIQYKAWTLVRGAASLAHANNMITIREKEMHSLAWAASTTIRENSTPIGQRLQNTPHWLILSWTTAKEMCKALKLHAFPFLFPTCPSQWYKAPLQPIILVETVFLSPSAIVQYQQLFQGLWEGMRVKLLFLYNQ